MLKYFVTVYDRQHRLICWTETSNKHEAERMQKNYSVRQYSYAKVEQEEKHNEVPLQHRASSQYPQLPQ
jgi:hypothetical protein